ncbi:tRNA 2-thiocytidine biosynthesis TtcA family protein [Hydrogenoanaerobacterium sp.]|uniref:tRNA 2-thiocytidine biosynthesis TtcA family protein n=1 Tax=Hydrogenoanaerobacterium sp. TaxID=2953763 RepID=UPI0028A0F879|nr:tRNA 2-thiocytidine biosynthesis TtcA family protein [Hydrogenoanaerobacterium sp.]
MQKMIGYMRKAITDYHMIEPGDGIAVGVSGGKDSVTLLCGLAKLRNILGIDYKVVAITLDPGFSGEQTDYSLIQKLCDELDVPYMIKRTQIGEVVFDIRKEENPCSLCARMRRGALHDAAIEAGCNKVALGHHYDDAVETFMMNLFNEGRVGCFQPVTYLSRKNITMIRPMVYAPEKDIKSAVKRCELPVVKSKCPADGVTERTHMKEYLANLEHDRHGIKKRIFGAMVRGHVSGW